MKKYSQEDIQEALIKVAGVSDVIGSKTFRDSIAANHVRLKNIAVNAKNLIGNSPKAKKGLLIGGLLGGGALTAAGINKMRPPKRVIEESKKEAKKELKRTKGSEYLNTRRGMMDADKLTREKIQSKMRRS